MTAVLDTTAFPALGTTCVVLVSDARALQEARELAERVIAKVDRACSRFRDDSDLARVNANPGTDVAVSPWLIDALDVSLRAAHITNGLVDPTIGGAMRVIGYDRDFAQLRLDGPPMTVRVREVPGWQRITVNYAHSTVRVEPGVDLDLGATAKAWCADRAARTAARHTGVGVVIGLGGDLSSAGAAPEGGWRVHVSDDHRDPVDSANGETVVMHDGGIATSGTSVRRWARGARAFHHIIDPKTGLPADDHWRTVSVAAASCADANIASTASVILGTRAPEWLAQHGLAARLVAYDGAITYTEGWPR